MGELDVLVENRIKIENDILRITIAEDILRLAAEYNKTDPTEYTQGAHDALMKAAKLARNF